MIIFIEIPLNWSQPIESAPNLEPTVAILIRIIMLVNHCADRPAGQPTQKSEFITQWRRRRRSWWETIIDFPWAAAYFLCPAGWLSISDYKLLPPFAAADAAALMQRPMQQQQQFSHSSSGVAMLRNHHATAAAAGNARCSSSERWERATWNQSNLKFCHKIHLGAIAELNAASN